MLCVWGVICGQHEKRYTSFGNIPLIIEAEFYEAIDQSKDELSLFEALKDLAEIHENHGNSDSVIYYGNWMHEVVRKIDPNQNNYSVLKSKSDFISGIGKLDKGLQDEALKHFLEGISELSIAKNPELFYSHKIGLGRVYLAKYELDEATDHFQECINESNSKKNRIEAFKYMGDLYLIENKKILARQSYERSLELNGVDQNEKFKLKIQLKLARINVSEGRVDETLETLEEIKNVALDKKYFDIYVESVLGAGEIYMQLENYDVANMILSTAYVNAVQWNWLELQQEVQLKLIDLNIVQNDHENAYNLMTQYVGVSNEIVANQSKEGIKELEIKYKTLQKENEILALQEAQLLKETELNTQKTIKNSFLIGFLIILIPIIGLLIVYYQKLQAQSELNSQKDEIKRQEVASLIKEQELKLARASVQAQEKERGRIAQELHDSIGGNLAAIKLQLGKLSDGGDAQKSIVNQVDETYQQVREISHDLTPKIFGQNTFATIIEHYIFNLNNSENISIDFQPYPKNKVNELALELQVEIYKIIQELITNTVKHAEASNVEIHINVFEEEVQLIYEDDGKGFDVHSVNNGIGLQSVNKRVGSFSGRINMDSEINRGTAYTIEIPIK